MHKIFFALLSLLLISCAGSQNADKWSTVTYMYETGPLPPKYQYSYNLTIHSTGDGNLVCFIGADPSNSSITYEFKCKNDDLKKITEAIDKSKILDEDITQLPEGKRPIGGHLEKVRVVLTEDNPNLDRAPRMKESPYFPDEKYRKGLNNLFETLRKLIPEKNWNDFEMKKSEFQSKN